MISFQERPKTILRTVHGEMSKRLPIAELSSPIACARLISWTFVIVNLWARFGLFIANRLWAECALFSFKVLQAKLTARLSVFFPFKWLTVGRVGSGIKKAIATSLCTNRVSPKLTREYPFCDNRVLRIRSVEMRRTRPWSLTSYLGCVEMFFHNSMSLTPGGRESISYHKRGG
jgi:hypothetical protein